MAASILSRSLSSLRNTTTFRLLISITRPPPISPFPRPTRPSLLISHSVRVVSSTRFSSIRCRVNRSGPYTPLNKNSSGGSNFSDRPPSEIAPLFPGCDYEHWLIVMDKPGGEGATKQEMIDCYIKTLAQVVGSNFWHA